MHASGRGELWPILHIPPNNCTYTSTPAASWVVLYLDEDGEVLAATDVAAANPPPRTILMPRSTVYVPSRHAIVSYGGYLSDGGPEDAAAVGVNWTTCTAFHWGQCLVPVYATHVFDVQLRSWTSLPPSATGSETPTGPPGTALYCCDYGLTCQDPHNGRPHFSIDLQYGADSDLVWALAAEGCLNSNRTNTGVYLFLQPYDWTWHALLPGQPLTSQERLWPLGLGQWTVPHWNGSASIAQYGGMTWSDPQASYVCWIFHDNQWLQPPYCNPDYGYQTPFFIFDSLFDTLPDGSLLFFAGRQGAPTLANFTTLSQQAWRFYPSSLTFELQSIDVQSVPDTIAKAEQPAIMPGTLASTRMHLLVDGAQRTYISWGGVLGNVSGVRTAYEMYESCAHRYGGEEQLSDMFVAIPQVIHVFRTGVLPVPTVWPVGLANSAAVALFVVTAVWCSCAAALHGLPKHVRQSRTYRVAMMLCCGCGSVASAKRAGEAHDAVPGAPRVLVVSALLDCAAAALMCAVCGVCLSQLSADAPRAATAAAYVTMAWLAIRGACHAAVLCWAVWRASGVRMLVSEASQSLLLRARLCAVAVSSLLHAALAWQVLYGGSGALIAGGVAAVRSSASPNGQALAMSGDSSARLPRGASIQRFASLASVTEAATTSSSQHGTAHQLHPGVRALLVGSVSAGVGAIAFSVVLCFVSTLPGDGRVLPVQLTVSSWTYTLDVYSLCIGSLALSVCGVVAGLSASITEYARCRRVVALSRYSVNLERTLGHQLLSAETSGELIGPSGRQVTDVMSSRGLGSVSEPSSLPRPRAADQSHTHTHTHAVGGIRIAWGSKE